MDPRSFLPYLLNQAAEECSLAFQALYRERYGFRRTEWRVLFHLGRFGEMTAQEICVRSRMHKTKISRAVAKLAEKRLLARTADSADRRREFLKLTPAGEKVYRDLQVAAARYDAELLREFSPDEERLLRTALRRLAKFSDEDSAAS